MAYSFNLLENPWLSCVDDQNQLHQLNLLQTITRANHIREIQDNLPVMTGSLYLFLTAFVLNIFKPETDEDWESIWREGGFSEAKVVNYSEQWKSRFDIFDPEFPFYQDPKFGNREKDLNNLTKGKLPEPKGISGMLLHMASGNNATLFDHSLDDQPMAIPAAQAAQLLVMLQAYSLGGMSSASIGKDKYFKDSPFGRGILFLNKGKNLFETLMLNLTSTGFDPLMSSDDDHPSWEREDPFESERFSPNGMLDFLTWQSRRILLLPEMSNGKVVVPYLFTAPGQGLVNTFSNPFYHNRLSMDGNKQSIKPLRFREGHSLWRDSQAILDIKSSNFDTPIPIRWAAHLRVNDILRADSIQLELFGMCTQPAQKKVYFYANEIFIAPAIFLEDLGLLEDLQNGLAWAEEVRSNLYIAVRELARFKVVPMNDQENIRVPGREDTDPLMQHWNTEHLYWSNLEPAFYDYLISLPKSEQAHDVWQQAIRQAAHTALDYAVSQVGTDPAGLKARAKAERTLNYLLYKTFNPSEKE